MSRDQYMKALADALSELDKDELYQALQYYAEIIDDRIEDGMSEEEAVAGMEPVAAAARRVLDERAAVRGGENETRQADETDTDGAPRDVVYEADAASVRSIRVDVINARVRVTGREGGPITLRYSTSERAPQRVTLQNGELLLCRIEARKGFGHGLSDLFGLAYMRAQYAEVELPAAYKGSLDVTTRNGAVEVTDTELEDALTLVTSNGRLILRNAGAKQIDARTSNGQVSLEKVMTNGNLSARTSNGAITADGVLANGEMELKTSNGAIRAEKLSSPEISLVSSNGRITAQVLGDANDYRVTGGTSNAYCHLPQGGTGAKTLCAHTSNAPIDVRIEKM